jgi:prophage antirepressor-like protein
MTTNTAVAAPAAVQLFNFRSNQIRVVMIDGEPWFVANDVAAVLGFTNMSTTIYSSYISDAERGKRFLGGRSQTMNVLSESGLYKMVMRSDCLLAKPFQDWVTKEVLPAIRKDGAYVMGEEKVKTGEMSEDELVLKALTMLKGKVERITKERDEALKATRGRRRAVQSP